MIGGRLFPPPGPPEPPHERTLTEARAAFFAALDDGIHCPCCAKWGKRYKRKFNETMACALIWLVRRYDETHTWVNLATAPRFVLRSKQLQTTRLWNLVAPNPENDDETKKTSGLWVPTELGVDFVYRRVSIPQHVWEFSSTVERVSDRQVTITEALGVYFNYAELMESGRWPD